MANELSARATPGKTGGYFVARRQANGQTCIPGTPSTFEQEVIAHWSTYAIAATESDHANGGTGLYQASMPASVPVDIIDYDLFFQVGGSPAVADGPPVASGWINWTGAADVISILGGVAQTGDSFARLGAPANATIAADIAEVEGETDAILAAVSAGGVTVTYIGAAVPVDGGTVLIYTGSAYTNANGRPITIAIPPAVQNLTGIPLMQMRWNGGTLSSTSINNAGLSNQSVTFEANATATAAMTPYTGAFSLWAIPSDITETQLDATGTIAIISVF